MDQATSSAKMAVEIDRVRSSHLMAVFGWNIAVDELDAFVKMATRKRPEKEFLLRINFEDFPRQAPSYVFVDPKTRAPKADAWPPGVKHGATPDGICIAGTRECHSHYHRNDAQYAWDASERTVLSTLTEIHRLMEKGLGVLH